MSEKQPQLEQLQLAVPELIKDADYSELYGVDFSVEPTAYTASHKTILAKFLKANENDLTAAKEQLLKTLKWRKEFNPLKAATEESHDEEFEKLGLITRSPSGLPVTWNLYGAVKNRKELFSRLKEFLRWRVGLMERGISLMDLSSEESSYMDQVHDYMDVSFLRMDSETRAASHEAVRLFSDYYPEFLRNKYFVNFSYLMSWVFTMLRVFMSRATSSKFKIVNDGTKLAAELGDWVPKQYGGKGESLLVLSQNTFADSDKKAPKAGEPTPTVALEATSDDANANADATSAGANADTAGTAGADASNE